MDMNLNKWTLSSDSDVPFEFSSYIASEMIRHKLSKEDGFNTDNYTCSFIKCVKDGTTWWLAVLDASAKMEIFLYHNMSGAYTVKKVTRYKLNTSSSEYMITSVALFEQFLDLELFPANLKTSHPVAKMLYETLGMSVEALPIQHIFALRSVCIRLRERYEVLQVIPTNSTSYIVFRDTLDKSKVLVLHVHATKTIYVRSGIFDYALYMTNKRKLKSTVVDSRPCISGEPTDTTLNALHSLLEGYVNYGHVSPNSNS